MTIQIQQAASQEEGPKARWVINEDLLVANSPWQPSGAGRTRGGKTCIFWTA